MAAKVSKPKVVTKYAQTKYNLTRVSNRKADIKHSVTHYTATLASAKNNCLYFGGGNRNASADFFIDQDGTIYQFNANLNLYYSWHCGDGYGKYGITNYNSIGIEVVCNGGLFTKEQQESLRDLNLWLMSEYGILPKNVDRHYDASRKLCPKPYCGSAIKNKRWTALHSYITTAKAANTKPAVKSKFPYKVKINTALLNVRKGAGTKYKIVTAVEEGEVFNIIEEKNGWGRLKSKVGWIKLSYTVKY